MGPLPLSPLRTVAFTALFDRKAAALLTPEQIAALTNAVAVAPESGDLIPESGGLRKVRVAARGQGKRGGARAIYYAGLEGGPIYMITIYGKDEKANLTKEDLRIFRRVIDAIRAEHVRSKGKGL